MVYELLLGVDVPPACGNVEVLKNFCLVSSNDLGKCLRITVILLVSVSIK